MTTTDENVGGANAGNEDNTAARIEVVDGPGEDAVVSDVTPRGPENVDPQDTPEPQKRPRWFQDEQRDAIVANFRRQREGRAQEETDNADEIAEYMRSGGMPKEFQDTFVDEEPPGDTGHVEEVHAEPEPQPEPRKFKLKVRGGEREVTEEELIALAQKNEAADEYMSEAKTLLSEVKAVKRDLESRPSPTATPAADSAATEDPSAGTGDQHQVNPYKDMAEALLYGDPDTAAVKTETAFTSVVPKIVERELSRHRRNGELKSSLQVADRFARENPDIASDQDSVDSIKARIVRKQREDLAKMGVDVTKLPTDYHVTNFHLDLRSDDRYAAQLRSPEQMFEEAKTDFLKWKGVTPTPKTNGNGNGNGAHVQAQRTTPEIQVDVNRTDRRRAIQPQPSRTAVVRQAPQAAEQPKTRPQIIAEMRKARGQPVA